MRDPQARPARTPALSPQVCEPQGSRPPSRRWNVSREERWRLAVLGGGERPGLPGATLSYRDLAQIVAQLVSQDVDKDVLFPHPPRSAESSSAFQAFLVRSAPFWHSVTQEAQASRSPPS
ncbi:PREDICTED: testis-expressed sequence 22 protein [Lipotes vexillifer]|nr:PREDICTED: testis-expressed sequence 22 protein [Lipotes vexillifer]